MFKTATCSSPADSDWLEKDWHGEIKDEDKMRKKERKEKPEKGSSYYPPELIYDPWPEREVLILVTDLVPSPIPGVIKSESQKRKEEEERIENRIIVEGIIEDDDLDYYSNLDSMYQSYV